MPALPCASPRAHDALMLRGFATQHYDTLPLRDRGCLGVASHEYLSRTSPREHAHAPVVAPVGRAHLYVTGCGLATAMLPLVFFRGWGPSLARGVRF